MVMSEYMETNQSRAEMDSTSAHGIGARASVGSDKIFLRKLCKMCQYHENKE